MRIYGRFFKTLHSSPTLLSRHIRFLWIICNNGHFEGELQDLGDFPFDFYATDAVTMHSLRPLPLLNSEQSHTGLTHFLPVISEFFTLTTTTSIS